ncbi:hypothetical protein OPV22_010151 [Ensete ventricosum]|uniref:Leucine-rich repeat-containing N-terminal plant-type domain-containing protein n=1 Tax=Ensete ventricosum TaxID=4639 RepID=A0AAV8PUW9_ENSVE|nr:hypothetical protein OPV22_010151 [Ensete ventricosum]
MDLGGSLHMQLCRDQVRLHRLRLRLGPLRHDTLPFPLPPPLCGSITVGLLNCTGLRHLDLGFNSLAGAVPGLAPLNKLRVLNLSDNALTGLFPWVSLGNLTALEVLSLGDNFFDPSPFPEVVVKFAKLAWLFLIGLQHPRRDPVFHREPDAPRRPRTRRQLPHRWNHCGDRKAHRAPPAGTLQQLANRKPSARVRKPLQPGLPRCVHEFVERGSLRAPQSEEPRLPPTIC